MPKKQLPDSPKPLPAPPAPHRSGRGPWSGRGSPGETKQKRRVLFHPVLFSEAPVRHDCQSRGDKGLAQLTATFPKRSCLQDARWTRAKVTSLPSSCPTARKL